MEGYNAGLVLFNALKTANTTDGTKLAEAIAKTKDLQVANGKFSYNESMTRSRRPWSSNTRKASRRWPRRSAESRTAVSGR